MYQYGETVVTPRERMSRAPLRLTLTAIKKKPPTDGRVHRLYFAEIPIPAWQSFPVLFRSFRSLRLFFVFGFWEELIDL
jgi:hypothetical protein